MPRISPKIILAVTIAAICALILIVPTQTFSGRYGRGPVVTPTPTPIRPIVPLPLPGPGDGLPLPTPPPVVIPVPPPVVTPAPEDVGVCCPCRGRDTCSDACCIDQ